MLKKIIKEILKYIGVFILLILIYFLSLTIVSLFNSENIKENVKESADYLITKKESERITLPYKNVYIFQFTNALMVNTAYSIDNKTPIESFLVARKNYIPGVTKVIHEQTPKDLQSAARYYVEGTKSTDAFQIAELYDTVYENNLYESFEYARYWHGYLTYLRPLLLIFNYEQIEILFKIVFIILLAWTSVLIFKKINFLISIALILSYLAVDTLVIAVSINEITCFIMSLIFSIYILIRNEKIKHLGLTFFIIGSITNFFDFLTNPILVYGLPVIIYFLLLQKRKHVSAKDTFLIYLKTSVSWALGYGLTWAMKWILTDLILNKGIIQNAIEQIKFRTNTNKYTYELLYEILLFFISESVIKCIVAFGICFMIIKFAITLFSIVAKEDEEILNKEIKKIKLKPILTMILIKLENILPYFIGILIPIVWYIVLLNHSLIHKFFTYRNIAISFFAFQIILIIFVSKNKLQKETIEKQ